MLVDRSPPFRTAETRSCCKPSCSRAQNKLSFAMVLPARVEAEPDMTSLRLQEAVNWKFGEGNEGRLSVKQLPVHILAAFLLLHLNTALVWDNWDKDELQELSKLNVSWLVVVFCIAIPLYRSAITEMKILSCALYVPEFVTGIIVLLALVRYVVTAYYVLVSATIYISMAILASSCRLLSDQKTTATSNASYESSESCESYSDDESSAKKRPRGRALNLPSVV